MKVDTHEFGMIDMVTFLNGRCFFTSWFNWSNSLPDNMIGELRMK